MTMTDTELAAIRARAEKATRGPWLHFHMPLGMADRVVDADDRYYVAQEVASDDAVFIAAARTDIPNLCDEVEALRGELAIIMPYLQANMDEHAWVDHCLQRLTHAAAYLRDAGRGEPRP